MNREDALIVLTEAIDDNYDLGYPVYEAILNELIYRGLIEIKD